MGVFCYENIFFGIFITKIIFQTWIDIIVNSEIIFESACSFGKAFMHNLNKENKHDLTKRKTQKSKVERGDRFGYRIRALCNNKITMRH